MRDPAQQIKRINVLGIHHVGIPCNDLKRAVVFYTEVLGMKLVKEYRNANRINFLGSNLPPDLKIDDKEAEADYQEYLARHKTAKPNYPVPELNFVQLQAGTGGLVLFERPEPIETDTLLENGLYHQAFLVSAEDMDHLTKLKQQGDNSIRFHTGPVLRWPHARTMYLWDTEGNYLELHSDDDLPARFSKSD